MGDEMDVAKVHETLQAAIDMQAEGVVWFRGEAGRLGRPLDVSAFIPRKRIV